MILKAVGLEANLQPEAGEAIDLQAGDEVILVSDGVHGVLEDTQIEQLVHGRPLDLAVDEVIAAARKRVDRTTSRSSWCVPSGMPDGLSLPGRASPRRLPPSAASRPDGSCSPPSS